MKDQAGLLSQTCRGHENHLKNYAVAEFASLNGAPRRIDSPRDA
jgi:hypothetical protein